jgi:adenylyl-sulfate kinase
MGGVIWFTGLSGSGKTTLAGHLREILKEMNVRPILLDGDEIRDVLDRRGFDEASRRAHNVQVGKLAQMLERQGHWVIVTLISPFASTRQDIRNLCANFYEVYVDTPLEVCISRDPKGLYKLALSDQITEFTGVSSPYEMPTAPELSVRTDQYTPEEGAQMIIDHIGKW